MIPRLLLPLDKAQGFGPSAVELMKRLQGNLSFTICADPGDKTETVRVG